MHLTEMRLNLLEEEIALMLQAHAELNAEVVRGLLQKVWEMSQRERTKRRPWDVLITKPERKVHLTPEEWDSLSAEEQALILASYRAVARSSHEEDADSGRINQFGG